MHGGKLKVHVIVASSFIRRHGQCNPITDLQLLLLVVVGLPTLTGKQLPTSI